MTEQDFRTAIQRTPIFKEKAIYSKNILLKYRLPTLFTYYAQAKNYGIDYLRQNPDILRGETAIIEQVLNLKN